MDYRNVAFVVCCLFVFGPNGCGHNANFQQCNIPLHIPDLNQSSSDQTRKSAHRSPPALPREHAALDAPDAQCTLCATCVCCCCGQRCRCCWPALLRSRPGRRTPGARSAPPGPSARGPRGLCPPAALLRAANGRRHACCRCRCCWHASAAEPKAVSQWQGRFRARAPHAPAAVQPRDQVPHAL